MYVTLCAALLGTGYVDETTGALLAQEQLKSYLMYGGEKVVFEKEEIADIKKIQSPGMQPRCDCAVTRDDSRSNAV